MPTRCSSRSIGKPSRSSAASTRRRCSGFYAKNSLDVSIIEGGSGTPTIQVLGAGKVDYAIVSADEVVISHDRGAKNVVALFATFQTNPQAIMAHAERGFHSVEDVLQVRRHAAVAVRPAVRAVPLEKVLAGQGDERRRTSAASATSRTIRCCRNSVSSPANR